MIELTNYARTDGTMADTDTYLETSLAIQMIDVTLEKTANHLYWATGPLTYTIAIENNEAIAYEDLVLTDTLPFALVNFVAGSVMRDGTAVDPADYNYNATTGVLTIQVGEVGANSSTAISFRVTKV